MNRERAHPKYTSWVELFVDKRKEEVRGEGRGETKRGISRRVTAVGEDRQKLINDTQCGDKFPHHQNIYGQGRN